MIDEKQRMLWDNRLKSLLKIENDSKFSDEILKVNYFNESSDLLKYRFIDWKEQPHFDCKSQINQG